MNESLALDIENPFTTLKLVDNIKKYPCLYNNTIPEYSRRDVTEQAWSNVAKEINETVFYCKKRWKNLRTVYLRKLKQESDGVLDPRKRPYYLRDRMNFILPFIKVTQHLTMVDEFPVIEGDEEDESEENQEEINASPSNNHQSENYNAVNIKIEPLQEICSKKRKHDIANDIDPLEVLTPQIQDNLEARKMFILSLLPELNELTEEQMKKFKRKVLELLDDITVT